MDAANSVSIRLGKKNRPDALKGAPGRSSSRKTYASVAGRESCEQDARILGVDQAVPVEIPEVFIRVRHIHRIDEIQHLADPGRPLVIDRDSRLDLTDLHHDGTIGSTHPNVVADSRRHLDRIEFAGHRIGKEDHEDSRCEPPSIGDPEFEDAGKGRFTADDHQIVVEQWRGSVDLDGDGSTGVEDLAIMLECLGRRRFSS